MICCPLGRLPRIAVIGQPDARRHSQESSPEAREVRARPIIYSLYASSALGAFNLEDRSRSFITVNAYVALETERSFLLAIAIRSRGSRLGQTANTPFNHAAATRWQRVFHLCARVAGCRHCERSSICAASSIRCANWRGH
jgi:hypothetical protein